MTQTVPGGRAVPHRGRDFWSSENLKFSRPHFRMQKVARLIATIAGDRQLQLLDIGCGPAALRGLLPGGVRYRGVDIAIQAPGPELVEADLLDGPIPFGDEAFDIVVAQGVFEYLPGVQSQRLAEIARLLTPGGTFVVTYWNYAHRNPKVYHAHTNVQRVADFRRDLEKYFTVDRAFPVSHNWYHGSPSMAWNKAINLRLNANLPVVSSFLGVEYLFVCVPRPR